MSPLEGSGTPPSLRLPYLPLRRPLPWPQTSVYPSVEWSYWVDMLQRGCWSPSGPTQGGLGPSWRSPIPHSLGLGAWFSAAGPAWPAHDPFHDKFQGWLFSRKQATFITDDSWDLNAQAAGVMTGKCSPGRCLTISPPPKGGHPAEPLGLDPSRLRVPLGPRGRQQARLQRGRRLVSQDLLLSLCGFTGQK